MCCVVMIGYCRWCYGVRGDGDAVCVNNGDDNDKGNTD